ncbi:hypothetical protein [Streptomyces olivaceus]|uniref:hypothetical protein n=1 Tax=Streptomyces olivaceus TaxID=47716 RepID=UPI001CCD4193|nr:hypothetical protein [Streptomyces olivaceus]MBZ6132872.1 hypothetical protein [Streptomyces olivaceus]
MTSTNPAGPDPAARPKRRTFSPEYKLRIVAEYDAALKNEKGAVLCRQVERLEKELGRNQAALEVLGRASALLEMISEGAG